VSSRIAVRVASLNLRAMPNRQMAKLAPLVELLASHMPDVVLLQECRAGWCEFVSEALGMVGLRSHDLLAGVQDCRLTVRRFAYGPI
jgi:hypothetical protein